MKTKSTPKTAFQIRIMQHDPMKEHKLGFFLELYQFKKPTWDSIKKALEAQISDIEFDLLEKHEPNRDYNVMASRRAWIQDLVRHIPKGKTAPLPEDAGRALRIREIEIA